MEHSTAEMTCILKINTQCKGCKAKVMQILRNIRGVYNITVDGEQGTVKVTGRVNPSTLLGVLEKYGKHAEVKYIKFDGEVVERIPQYYYGQHGCAPYAMECSYPQHQCYPPPLPPPQPPLWAPPPRPYGPIPFLGSRPFRHNPTFGQNTKVRMERNRCAMM